MYIYDYRQTDKLIDGEAIILCKDNLPFLSVLFWACVSLTKLFKWSSYLIHIFTLPVIYKWKLALRRMCDTITKSCINYSGQWSCLCVWLMGILFPNVWSVIELWIAHTYLNICTIWLTESTACKIQFTCEKYTWDLLFHNIYRKK